MTFSHIIRIEKFVAFLYCSFLMKGFVFLVAIVVLIVCICCGKESEDEKYANEVIKNIDSAHDVDDGTLKQLVDNDKILIAILPVPDKSREGFNMYWPEQYYNRYDVWPKNLFTRMRYWSPTFYIGSGWSYALRPGMHRRRWPRNVWIRNNDSYYFVSNK